MARGATRVELKPHQHRLVTASRCHPTPLFEAGLRRDEFRIDHAGVDGHPPGRPHDSSFSPSGVSELASASLGRVHCASAALPPRRGARFTVGPNDAELVSASSALE